MTGWAVLAFCFAAFFAVAAVWPRATWRVSESWRYRDPEANEPSDTAYTVQRVAFVVMTACSVGLGIHLLGVEGEGRRAECDRILTELGSAVPVDLTGISVEAVDARWDFYDAASRLGVSVESERGADEVSYTVVRDGEVLGTIDESGVGERRCDGLD